MAALEATLVGVAGGVLGWLAGLSVGLSPLGAAIGAVAGFISGIRGIYDWRAASGWIGFILDSTWGLITTAGSVLFHLVQTVMPSGSYRADLSQRRGRHVYEGGYRIKPGFATAIGNVITNADGTTGLDGPGGPRRRLLIDRHEMLHVWQHRWFGPFFPLLYTVWTLVGAIVGLIMGAVTIRPTGRTILTLAYYDNPFEYWAYRRDRYWPPAGADPALAWRGKAKDERSETLL